MPSPAPSGPAHVATVSFLASRAVPTGGFWVALAGGVALARVAERRGLRQGIGASAAAMLETVAIMGPARFGVPLTQAITAPLLGRLEARSVRPGLQVLACGAIRMALNTAATTFFVLVIAGGLDAYAGTYDGIAGLVDLEVSELGVVLVTLAGLLAWAVFASCVQVAVYRRGLQRWGEDVAPPREPEPGEPPPTAHRGRFDPRAVTLAAGVGFTLLLLSTAWPLLAAVAAWLALAFAVARIDRTALPTGVAIALILGGSALVFSLGGGLGLDVALRRASRAILLVGVATWLRAAAGADGLREVARRSLGRVRRLPGAPEAARTLDEIGAEGRLLAAGHSLVDTLSGVPRRPVAVLDAVLAWVNGEARRFRPSAPAPVAGLRVRTRDAVLVVLAAAPLAALAL